MLRPAVQRISDEIKNPQELPREDDVAVLALAATEANDQIPGTFQ
jgi:hypothetical protein